MLFTQYYLDCLSHASYMVGDTSTGRAVVVDPQRDVSTYVQDADAAGLTIGLVVETHVHADFVSGHLELAAKTGAEIGYGAAARGTTSFPTRLLEDGERVVLGDVVLTVLETPGHTPESICLVVHENASDAAPYGVLTGDTLFVGDVGRPDLLAAGGVTAEELAAQLYDSLHDKLLGLPDETRVFPAHGAGSACGKALSTKRQSTLGEQRRTNYALAPMRRDEFVGLVTEGQPPAPPYFPVDAERNRSGHRLLDERGTPDPLPIAAVVQLVEDGARLLDTRDPQAFAAAHLVGSVNVGLGGRFAEYAGDVLDPDDRIVLVAEEGLGGEARVRLGRVGFDDVLGELEAPYDTFRARPDLVEPAPQVSAVELVELLAAGADVQVVDVRSDSEARLGTIPGATRLPLPRLIAGLHSLSALRPTVVTCASGYRSSVAASVLRAAGFADVSNLLGGYQAYQQVVARA